MMIMGRMGLDLIGMMGCVFDTTGCLSAFSDGAVFRSSLAVLGNGVVIRCSLAVLDDGAVIRCSLVGFESCR